MSESYYRICQVDAAVLSGHGPTTVGSAYPEMVSFVYTDIFNKAKQITSVCSMDLQSAASLTEVPNLVSQCVRTRP